VDPEPAPPERDTRRIRRRFRMGRRRWAAVVLVVAVSGSAIGAGAVANNAFNAGYLFTRLLEKFDRFIAGPVPDRSTAPTIEVTPEPETPSPSPTPAPSPPASGAPPDTAAPTPTPIPRVAVDVDIVTNHDAIFAHELRDDWCAPAGLTIVLAITGHGAPTDARERDIASRVHEWESYADSHNGLWGPSAMALALDAYGLPGYRVVAYPTRSQAIRGAAKAIATTNSPAILIAWYGAHTWVMTGYRADADPLVFADAKISGAYIDDPWYPWTSSLWGKSDPPGAFHDNTNLRVNFLPWQRPEGLYRDRDGKFIVVIPTIPRG
jgi:hypothetical protein